MVKGKQIQGSGKSSDALFCIPGHDRDLASVFGHERDDHIMIPILDTAQENRLCFKIQHVPLQHDLDVGIFLQ